MANQDDYWAGFDDFKNQQTKVDNGYWTGFDEYQKSGTLPSPVASNNTTPTLGDYGRAVAAGAAAIPEAASSGLRMLGADSAADYLGNNAKAYREDWMNQMTPAGKAAATTPFLGEDGSIQNWRAIPMSAAESLAGTVAMGGMGKVAMMPLKALGAAESIAPALTRLGLGSKVATGIADNAVSGLAYGGAEGVFSGLGNAEQKRQEILQTPQEQMAQNPSYQSLIQSGLSDADARDSLSKDAMRDVFAKTAASTGGLSWATGGGMFGQLENKVGGGLLKRIGKGMLSEGLMQEGPQSFGESVIGNIATQNYGDPNRGTFEGTLNETLTGAGAGALMGGGAGIFTAENQPQLGTQWQKPGFTINPYDKTEEPILGASQRDVPDSNAIGMSQDEADQVNPPPFQINPNRPVLGDWQNPLLGATNESTQTPSALGTNGMGTAGNEAAATDSVAANRLDEGNVRNDGLFSTTAFGTGLATDPAPVGGNADAASQSAERQPNRAPLDIGQGAINANQETQAAGLVAQEASAPVEDAGLLQNIAPEASQEAIEPIQSTQEATNATEPSNVVGDAGGLSGADSGTGSGTLRSGLGDSVDGAGGTGLESAATPGNDNLDSVAGQSLAPAFTETDKDNRFKLTNVADLGGTEAVRSRIQAINQTLPDGQKLPVGNEQPDGSLQFHSRVRDRIAQALTPVQTNDEPLQLSSQSQQPTGQNQEAEAKAEEKIAPWDAAAQSGEQWQEDRWFNTRVQVAPSMKGDQGWEGTVQNVLRTSSGQPWLEVKRDGQDGSVRITPDRVSVLDLKDSAITPEAQAVTPTAEATTPEAQQKPKPGLYQQPSNVSSAAGQTDLANRGSRIAALSQLNERIAQTNPEAAYAPDEIANAADDRINAMQDWLISKQEPTNPTTQASQPAAQGTDSGLATQAPSNQAPSPTQVGQLGEQGVDPAADVAPVLNVAQRGQFNGANAVLRKLGKPELTEAQWLAEQGATQAETPKQNLSEKLKANAAKVTVYDDPRMKRATYRNALPSFKNEIVKGGDVAYLTDENGKISGRTQSVNAQWFQSLPDDTRMSVEQAQKAIDKAVEGKKLGVREERLIVRLLDQIGEERNAAVDYAKARREEMRQLRRFFNGDDTAYGELHNEQDYDTEDEAYTRVLIDLGQRAREAGVDEDVITDLLSSQQSDEDIAKSLQEAINGRVRQESTEDVQTLEGQSADQTGDLFPAATAEERTQSQAEALAEAQREQQRRSNATQAPPADEGIFALDNRQEDVFGEQQAEPAEPTQPKTRAQKLRASRTTSQAATTTEDAGEELTANRRNRIRTGIRWDDIKDKNESLRVKETTKANVYPKPDWAALSEDMNPMSAYLVKTVYDRISSTPQKLAPTDSDLQTYIDGIHRIMGAVMDWAKDAQYVSNFKVASNGQDLLSVLYPDGWLKATDAEKAEIRLLGGNRFWKALQPGYDERVRAERDIKDGWPAKKEAWQKQGYSVISRDEVSVVEGNRGRFLVQMTSGGRYAGLHSAHDTRAEAQAVIDSMKPWLTRNKRGEVIGQEDTQEAAINVARDATKRTQKPSISEKGIAVESAQRVGPDYRQPGEDISSERLKETFGFRGVNFGEWMKGKSNEAERQLHLNHAYDSMMDLSTLLNVPPKALSMNGILGMAVGAQGQGKYAAHFVPGVNEINLTRTSGAGSLAHEWGHALDHYFATQAGLSRAADPFITEHVRPGEAAAKMGDGIRPEIVSRITEIVSAMRRREQTPAEAEAERVAGLQKARSSLDMWIRSFDRNTGLAENPEYAALMERLRNQDIGEGTVYISKKHYVSPVVAELYKVVKEQKVKYPTDQFYGLYWAARMVKHAAESIDASGTHQPQMTDTDYMKEARKLDADKKGKKYWSTPWEMFARAFDAYVSDKIAEKSEKNTYLSHAGRQDSTTPAGTERAAINAAFDALVNEIKTKETDQGVAMFSREPRFSFAGQQAATADTYQLDTAMKSLEKGASAESVRRETGWFRGAEGKWRFEISDDEARFKVPDIAKAEQGTTYALGDMLEHPKLFAAYPELTDLQVKIVDPNWDYGGMYYPASDSIAIAGTGDEEGMFSVLMHEIQHAIQEREGFARGGPIDEGFTKSVKSSISRLAGSAREAVGQWKWANSDKLKQADAASEKARYALMYESAQRLISYANRDKPSGVFRLIRNELQWIYTPDFKDNEAAGELQRDFYAIPKSGIKRNQRIRDMAFRGGQVLLGHIPDNLRRQFKADERTVKSMVAALQREASKADKKLAPLRDLEDKMRRAEAIRNTHEYSGAYSVYQALAGEVEARNTQARLKMTEAERQSVAPRFTADVSPENIIVMVGGLDIQAPSFSGSQSVSGRPSQQEVRPALSRDAVQAIIDEVRVGLRINPNIKIRAVAEEPELSPEIQEQARKEGATGQIIAVHHGDTIWLVANKHASRAKVEESIYHESTHYGSNVAFGRAKHAIYNRLFNQLGGEKGIRDYANRLGLKMEPYFTTARGARGNIQDQRINSYLVDEFLAHVQGNKAYATLPQKIKTAIQEFYGAIRNWLRQQGFAELAKFTDADLAYLLRSIHQAAQGNAAIGSSKPMFMVGWHGTPYDFDRFSTDAIGTGEGAQAFGYGLYFTNAKDIGEWYRNKLTEGKFLSDDKPISPMQLGSAQSFMLSMLQNRLAARLPLREAKQQTTAWAKKNPQITEDLSDEAIEKFVNGLSQAKGRLYQVELAPAEDEYLDWHKPLSEQSEKVKAAVKTARQFAESREGQGGISIKPVKNSVLVGEGLYGAVSRATGSDQAASEYLHSLGIRGIRYPAEGQTGGKSGDRFNYVIFDENDVEITAKFSRGKMSSMPENTAPGPQGDAQQGARKGDAVADFQDRLIAAQDMADAVQSTGQRLQIRGDGYVTLYHSTSNTAADSIRATGEFTGNTWFSASKAATMGHARPKHGKNTATLEIPVDPRTIEFSTGTGEFYAPNGLVRDENGYWSSPNDSSASDNAGAMFSRETPTINVDGQERPTTNSEGRPIHPTEEGVRNFWRWFGSSQAKDGLGQPRLMYHGTANDISEFKGFVNWFAESPAFAGEYAEMRDYNKGGGANLTPAYVRSENPFDADRLTRGANTVASFVNEMVQQAKDNGARINNDKVLGLFNTLREARLREESGPNYAPYEFWMEPENRFGKDGAAAIKELFSELGFDSINFTEDGQPTIGVLSANQVKSATGNSGDFSPANNDIRFSRQYTPEQQGGWNTPVESKMDNLIRTLQNKHIDTKRVVEAIKEARGSIEDRFDPELKIDLYDGRVANRLNEFLLSEVEPFYKALGQSGVSVDELEKYLHARHAEERNIQMAKVNQAYPDGGSGMTTQEANDYLASVKNKAVLDKLAAQVDAINTGTKKLLVDEGLETQSTIDAWDGAYEHYVPLFREEAEGEQRFGNGTGPGFSVRGSASKRAMGSSRNVVDILANSVMARERALTRAEKNRVSTALFGAAVQNPADNFWRAVDPSKSSQNEMQDWLEEQGLEDTEIEDLWREPRKRVIDKRTGQVTYRLSIPDRFKDNVVSLRIDGKDKFIFFNQDNPRALEMARALKNLDTHDLGTILTGMRYVTRWISSVNTQFNPIFGITNIIRDTGAGLLNLESTDLKGQQMAVLKEIPSALAGIYRDVRADRKGQVRSDSEYSKLFEEFEAAGGETGYRDMFRTSKDRADALQKIIDPGAWADTKWGKLFTANGKLKVPIEMARKAAQPLFDWLSDYNRTLENSVRLAAYKVAKDNGMSKERAAQLAKNLTVNFNKKGQIAQQAGAMYAFFNASMQGSARIAETLLDKRGNLTESGKMIVKGGMLLGVAQAVMLSGYDDDEPPEFVREKNFVIPLPDGKYLSVPYPLGFHILPNTGRVLTDMLLRGKPGDRVASILGSFVDAFNPIGSAGLSMQTIAPTFADPGVALAENRDWTGKPIAKENFSSLSPTPGFTRAKDTASWFGRVIAEMANTLSGGTDYVPGAFSPTPDQIDYLIGQATGGVGRELMKAQQFGTSLFTGEEIPPYKVPGLGRFFGSTKSQAAESSRFYDNLTHLNMVENTIRGLKKDGKPVQPYLRETPEARLVKMSNTIETDIRELRARKRALLEKDAPKMQIQLIENAITTKMKRLNEAVAKIQPN